MAQAPSDVGVVVLITLGIVAYPDSFVRYYYLLFRFVAAMTSNW